MNSSKPPFVLALLASALLCLEAGAQSNTANFDGLPEGVIGPTYVEDGITFSNLDLYQGSGSEPFAIEDASSTLAGLQGFTAPNALGFSSFTPGSVGALNRCGSFKITVPERRNRGKLRFYVDGALSEGNAIVVRQYYQGSLNGVVIQGIPAGAGPTAIEIDLFIRDYDELLVRGAFNLDPGAFYGLLDSVFLEYRPPFSSYCRGDGTPASCPCGNSSPTPGGCANSSGEGAYLWGLFGTDSLIFGAFQLPRTTPALLFRGTSNLPTTPFGDGQLCVGGAIERIGVKMTSTTGGVSWGLWPEPVHYHLRYYQVWYRDNSPSAPCGSGFNTSSAIKYDMELD